MRLLHKLVRFDATMKTKEARDDNKISCIRWKIDFDSIPRLLKKSFQLWREFAEQLLQKKIKIIVNFNMEIEIIYQILDDR